MDKKIPTGYIVLWAIVIALLMINVLGFVVFQVGQGRWDCIAYTEEKCYVTCYEGIKTTTYEGECGEVYPVSCSGNTVSKTIEPECIKEIWSKKS